MNIPTNWRDKRTCNTPMYNPYASFGTDSKINMKKTFADEMLLTNFHLSPDALWKNLADTMVSQEKMAPKNNKQRLEKEEMKVETKMEENLHMHEDFSPPWGFANFVSGVVNVISNVMFTKRKPVEYSSNSGSESALPSMWHKAKLSDENKTVQNEHFADDMASDFLAADMSDCRSAANHCQSKLAQIRLLLNVQKPTQTTRVRRQPKKVFVEPNSVEECFEDAFSPEDFENLANDSYVEYYSPVCFHEPMFHETDSPKVKIETALSPKQVPESPVVVSKSSEVLDTSKMVTESHSMGNVPTDATPEVLKQVSEISEFSNEASTTVPREHLVQKNTESLEKVPALNSSTCKLDMDANKKELVESCEDKITKLKLLLQERRKKPKIEDPPAEIVPVANFSKPPLDAETQLALLPPKLSSSKVKDKRFKNPNRCSDKRKKTRMKKSIQDDLMFANEINCRELSSSVESSPSSCILENFMRSVPQCVQNPRKSPTEPKPIPTKDYFDEVSGCFKSASVESDDSFQIVFHDGPRASQSSDCESEDFDIIFEDSPDSCYTSNDVFGDSEDDSDSDEYDSDSDMSDSGCGMFKLSATLSKSVSNLADDSLYNDQSGDEVDCANIQDLTICDSVAESEIDDVADLADSKGVLLTEKKKLLRKNLPAKRVHFSPHPPKVHVMRVWLFAAKQTRVRYWQQYAVDRERFKRRIADVDMAVSWVLKPQHRSRVMFQRFMPWWNAQKRKEIAEKKEKEAAEKLKEEERLRNKEIGKQNSELSEAENVLSEENTDTCVTESQEEETKSGEEELKKDASYKVTEDNRTSDPNAGVDRQIVAEKRIGNPVVNESVEFENTKNSNKNLNEKLYGNAIVPLNSKTVSVNSNFVSLHPEYVKLNT